MEIQKIVDGVKNFFKDTSSAKIDPVNEKNIENCQKIVEMGTKILNKSKDSINNFIKDETGNEMKLEPKKTIALFVTLTSLSGGLGGLGGLASVTAKEKNPGPLNTTTSISQETKKINSPIETIETINLSIPLKDPVIAEYLTSTDRNNDIVEIKRIQLSNNIPKENIFLLRYPYKYSGSNKDPWATNEVSKRINLYIEKNRVLPQLVADGTNAEIYGAENRFRWEELLKNTTRKDHLAQFKAEEDKATQSFKIECETTDQKLIKNNNLNLVAISYQDWVNMEGANGETTYRNAASGFFGDPEGTKVKFDKNGKITKTISFKNITEEVRWQSGFVLLIQDRLTQKIYAVGLCRLAELDGIEEPAVGTWNGYPDHNLDFSGNLIDKKYLLQTGYEEMEFSIKNAKDISKVALGIKQDSNDKKHYNVLGYKINDDIKDNIKSIKFNKKTFDIEIELINPVSGNKKIFSFIIQFIKENIVANETMGFQLKNINIKSNNKIPYMDFNDIVAFTFLQLAVENNPYDLTDDASVNDKDMQKFLPEFGSESKDSRFEAKYDFNGDLRVNMEDLTRLLKEIKRQRALEEIVEKQNSNIIELKIGQPTPNDIQSVLNRKLKIEQQRRKTLKDQVNAALENASTAV